jgi:hypothetical protein
VVNLILSSLGRDELLEEIHRELTLLKEELQEGKVTIEKFEILKVRFKNYELSLIWQRKSGQLAMENC